MTDANTINIDKQGKALSVSGACVEGRTVFSRGRWLKVAAIRDEEFLEGENVPDPAGFVRSLAESSLRADIFTFAQKIPDIDPKHDLFRETDNFAVIPVTTYSDWLEKRVEYDVRKAIKKANKLGVVVRVAEFDDKFVEGICEIYNESAVRQGTAFWHYNKPFETVKQENSTFLERSVFIGAYFEDALIGFIRMVYVDNIASTLQVISQRKHFEKKPMSALIGKAVEICAEKGVSHLVYGNYIYHDRNSSLTEFKRRNGFEQMLVPRYYVPLSPLGAVALKLKLHRGPGSFVPESVRSELRRLRNRWYERKTSTAKA